MRFEFILTGLLSCGIAVSAQACSRTQLSSCLSSTRPTPTQQPPSQQTPCTDLPCKCEQMSSEYGCYRLNCPNDASAAQLNSQLAETCAPYFATKPATGTATAMPNSPPSPSPPSPSSTSTIPPAQNPPASSATRTITSSISSNSISPTTILGTPLWTTDNNLVVGVSVNLPPTSTGAPVVDVGIGGVGSIGIGGTGGVGVPRKGFLGWVNGVLSRMGRKGGRGL